MTLYQVWIEATGPSTGTEGRNATEMCLMGEAEAQSFDEACQIVCTKPPHDGRYLNRRADGQSSYYGARLWPTKAEASRTFNRVDLCGTPLGPAPHVRWLTRRMQGQPVHWERVLQVGRAVMDGSGTIVWEDVPEATQ